MPGTRRACSSDQAATRAAMAAAARERLRSEFSVAVAELRSRHHFHAWLKACAILPRYSPANVLLIASQARKRGLEFDTVASLVAWGRLGFRVRPGERGLLIRRPVKRRLDHLDPARPSTDERRVVNFRAGYVFCRAQVEPDPGKRQLPLELPDPPIRGRASRRELTRLEQSLTADGWTVTRADLARDVGGTCNLERRELTLSTGLEPDAQLRVLVHEAAHAEGAECIVEAATFIVCARIGLDVRTSSVPYVAGWDTADPGTIERDAAEIKRVALAVEHRVLERDLST